MRERITTTLKFPDIELCSHEPAPFVCRIWRPFSSFNYNPQSGEAHDEMIRWRKNSSHIQHSSRKWIIPRDSRTRNQERAKWNLIIKYGNFNCVFCVVVMSWTFSSSVGCFLLVGSKKELDTLRTVEDFFGSFGNLLDNWKLLDSVGVEQKEKRHWNNRSKGRQRMPQLPHHKLTNIQLTAHAWMMSTVEPAAWKFIYLFC